MEDAEFHLIRAVANHDEKAFETLVARYQAPVVSFIYRYVGDFYLAQDLTQEVFLRVFQAAPLFEPRGKVSNWLFKIAYNLSANELKRRKRLDRILERISAEGGCFMGSSPPGPAESGDRELEERLMTAIGRLPPKQRAALLLKMTEDLSYQEIGAILNVTVSSVESLIFRARNRLRQLVKSSSEAPSGSKARGAPLSTDMKRSIGRT
jgi:RNA polymerase sigma-70 factor (ECF subfamily)